MSSTVLEDVEQLQKLFGNLQAQASVFDRHLTEIGLTKEQLGKAKSGIAQLYGTLDKFQFEAVDAIMVGELTSGKEEARGKRKQLNREIEALRIKLEEMRDFACSLQLTAPVKSL